MDLFQLRDLLVMNEGLKLDFKQEYRLILPQAPGNTQDWRDLVNGQWHELIKDVIALANGNVGVPDKTGYLVIGVGDALQPDGTREIHDVSHLQLTTQKIIAKVNDVCEPPLPDLQCDQHTLDGKAIYIISIPPTPYVHETKKLLTTRSGYFDGTGKLANLREPKVYTEYTAFIRKGENIFPASANERRALETDKRFDLLILEQNIKYELINNLRTLLSKSEGQLYSPGIWYRKFRETYPVTADDSVVDGRNIKWLTLALIEISPSKRLSTTFIEQAISCGRYLDYDPQKGKYVHSIFLNYLQLLHINIDRLIDVANFPGVMNFLTLYNYSNLQDDDAVQVASGDLIAMSAMCERFEDIVEISSALLAYLQGNKNCLYNVNFG